MNIVLKDSQNTGNHDSKRTILHTFAESVITTGDTLVPKLYPKADDGDVLIIWNGLKGRLKHYADDFRAAGKPVITLETPLMNRDVDPEHYQSVRLGIDHICYTLGNFNLPEQADGERFKKLGIEFQPWRKTGKHIVIAMQLSDDASLCDVNIFDWLKKCIRLIRQHSKRPIVIKSHPMIQKKMAENPVRKMEADELKKMAKKHRVTIFESGEDNDRFDILDDCWAVVCLTTGLAIDCVIKGIPTITTHPGNFMSPIQSRKIGEIENPKMPDRAPWFNRLAYAQWNFDECANGQAWQHIREAINCNQ